MRLCNYSIGLLIMASIVTCKSVSGQKQGMVIDVDFPGGNIIVDNKVNKSTLYYEITSDTVVLRPDLRDTEGEWFYWSFRIKGAANHKMYFQFPGSKVGSFGPAYSNDRGVTWQWLFDELQSNHDHFVYAFAPNEDEVMFSSQIPYLQANFDKFITPYKTNSNVTLGSLTKSEKGRNVEKVYIDYSKNGPKYKVLITARHHAGESMASFALEGIISSILDSNSDKMKWLRENVEFLIVPFMDKDGVEDGDQGKNRKPYDHNRDYSEVSIYKSTAALRKEAMDWGGGKLKVGLDLHCPGLSGEWHEHIYFVGSREKDVAKQQRIFVDDLIKCQRGELKISPERAMLEFGTSWNNTTDPGSNQGRGFNQWASSIEGNSLAIGLELPFANNNGQKVTPQKAKLFGKDMADALSIYLQGL